MLNTAPPHHSTALDRKDHPQRVAGLDIALVGLSACTVVALGVAAFGLRAPMPPMVQWQKLQWPGYVVTGTVIKAADRSRNFAHGEVVRLELTSAANSATGATPAAPYPAYTVTLVPISARSHDGLRIDTLSETLPAMALKDPTQPQPVNGLPGPGKASIQWGVMGEKPAAQACITRTGLVSADSGSLTTDIASWQPTGPRARVMQVLGWADRIPWDCVLVSISPATAGTGQDKESAKKALGGHWQHFMTGWKAAQAWVQAPGANTR
jgi:hypothetical protein